MSKANEADSTRRGFLRLGSMLSGGAAAGLLVPWAGGKVLTLAEPAKAADLAVKAGAFPTSPLFQTFQSEAHELEERMRGYALGTLQYEPNGFARLVAEQRYKMQDTARPVWERGVETWSDLADIAEIAFLAAPKELTWDNREAYSEGASYTGTIVRHSTPEDRHVQATYDLDKRWYWAANAALIEGVLKLTGRTAYCPSIAHDEWRSVHAPNASRYLR